MFFQRCQQRKKQEVCEHLKIKNVEKVDRKEIETESDYGQGEIEN